MARVHRIGQKRKVTIFRLVTRNTYEAEMFLRASKKLGLDHALLTNLEVGRGALEEGDAHDINKLLRLGAYGVFDDDDSAAKIFVEENIDDILKNRAKVITITKEQRAQGDDAEAEEGEGAAAAASSGQVIAQRLNYNKVSRRWEISSPGKAAPPVISRVSRCFHPSHRTFSFALLSRCYCR